MAKMKLFGVCAGVAVVLAASAICASAASTKTRLELKAEGKPLKAGSGVLLVAGYSLGECYWEEQEFKVTVNGSRTDKLARTGEAGQQDNCHGGAKAIEITSAKKMIVKLAPMRINLEGPCVYEFKESPPRSHRGNGAPKSMAPLPASWPGPKARDLRRVPRLARRSSTWL